MNTKDIKATLAETLAESMSGRPAPDQSPHVEWVSYDKPPIFLKDEVIINTRKQQPFEIEYHGQKFKHEPALRNEPSECYWEDSSEIPADTSGLLPRIKARKSNERLVIDLLRELKSLQLEHDRRAATTEQVESQGKAIQGAIVNQETRLKETIRELRIHLDKNSVKRRLTIYSVLSVLISSILLSIELINEKIVIRSPFAEFAVIFSILFFAMARTLPDPKSK